uniref:Hpc2-related domain-containing protein n=1 Tax=Ananas comosus var. bracteatus TaxID=296719 RepID=A0A6V7Q7G5_ANACO|nr:unnamed protein product [Ananas comosus var. bracteatus]
MEPDKPITAAAAAAAARVTVAPQPPAQAPPSSSANPPNVAAAAEVAAQSPEEERRMQFYVELKPGETTIVSWKKLLREAAKEGGDSPRKSGSIRCSPTKLVLLIIPAENELKDDQPPQNRFSAVIEKIERLYMGKQSSDEEELDDIPDDDQYDTEDSFIDDAELDEYFQVDKLATKHTGYFVNKGKLEQIEPSSTPNVMLNRRRRKDSTKVCGEKDRDHDASMGDMQMITVAGSASVARGKSSSRDLGLYGEHFHEERRRMKNSLKAPTAVLKKKFGDYTSSVDNPTSAKLSDNIVLSLPSVRKEFQRHKAGASSHYGGQIKKSSLIDENARANKVRRKEHYAAGEFADMNSYGSVYPTQTIQPTYAKEKEGSSMRPKGTTLERAIRDLEKIVAECKFATSSNLLLDLRIVLSSTLLLEDLTSKILSFLTARPPSHDVHVVDPATQGAKRRLPQEVKQKLAKVARLSATRGKISEDELLDRLMGILGHLVQRETLKRNIRQMVELGLSAKQQKADRFQQIKKEINEMIRAHVSQMQTRASEQLDGSADDFKEGINSNVRKDLKGRYRMDAALEDRICDLYDLYVEGMDEDKGPQSRKLYVQLAELWPHGYMDNVGIKDAIYRSKERKRALYRPHKVRDEERIKRKKLASAVRVEVNSQTSTQGRAIQERLAIDSASHTIVSSNKPLSNQPLPLPTAEPRLIQGSKMIDKAQLGGSSAIADFDVKKKLKRKSESEPGETLVHPLKVDVQHGKERNKPHKLGDGANATNQAKLSPQVGCNKNINAVRM